GKANVTSGVISGAKLEQVITSLGEGLTNSEVEGIFADIKLDEDGNVNYAELAELYSSPQIQSGDNVILESQGWSEPEVTRHPEVVGVPRATGFLPPTTLSEVPARTVWRRYRLLLPIRVLSMSLPAESMALRKVMEIHDSHFPANGYVRYVPYLSNSIMDSAIVKRRASKGGTSAASTHREATPNVLYGDAPLAFF
ncbi:hypothetical protein FOZ63_002171, partial [Perkinsus olseni]